MTRWTRKKVKALFQMTQLEGARMVYEFTQSEWGEFRKALVKQKRNASDVFYKNQVDTILANTKQFRKRYFKFRLQIQADLARTKTDVALYDFLNNKTIAECKTYFRVLSDQIYKHKNDAIYHSTILAFAKRCRKQFKQLKVDRLRALFGYAIANNNLDLSFVEAESEYFNNLRLQCELKIN